MTEPAEVLFEMRGRAGLVTLNRPQALNALTHGMCRTMETRLLAWRDDPAIAHVIVQGAGGRAFSAGGDIRHIHDLGRAGDPRQIDFFRDEYRLDTLIHRYPKPITALIDGIVMGGGAGVSVNGRFRVATDKITFAMPEVGIGHFPDVGATFFLPRAPGEIGMWLALTGARLGQADSLHAGIATHTVPRGALGDLERALTEAADPEPVLARFHADPGPAPLAVRRPLIDAVFSADSVSAILKGLDAVGGPEAAWAASTAAEIRSKSPTSLEIAFRQMRRGRGAAFEDCMRIEYRIVSRLLKGEDLYEGVRAVIIDKDNKPRWNPASVAQVRAEAIEAHFATPPGGDLIL